MAKMEHELFMVAVEGQSIVVTVICAYPDEGDRPSPTGFHKCTYQVSIPRERAEDLTVDQLFEEARTTFLSNLQDL